MDTEMNPTTCPVCGYDLGFPPWRGDSPSDEICLSCGMQFGYYDAAPGSPECRRRIYAEWRQRWIDNGMPWNGVNQPPAGWDPAEQLKRLA